MAINLLCAIMILQISIISCLQSLYQVEESMPAQTLLPAPQSHFLACPFVLLLLSAKAKGPFELCHLDITSAF